MNEFGLTKERYQQMMIMTNNDKDAIRRMIEIWGVETCNKGYDIVDYDGTGLLEIEAIGEIGAYDDMEAVEKAIKDGIKIIPIEQLPINMDPNMRWFGWIDTKDNRERIARYCYRKSSTIMF